MNGKEKTTEWRRSFSGKQPDGEGIREETTRWRRSLEKRGE